MIHYLKHVKDFFKGDFMTLELLSRIINFFGILSVLSGFIYQKFYFESGIFLIIVAEILFWYTLFKSINGKKNHFDNW